jgi:[CysO sulfur-carrier protein]-S-L-cysteine hydrolase
MISQLIFTQDQYDDMLRYVAEHVPLEACGLLAGKNGRVRKILPVQNQARSPVRFVMDPYEQLQAFKWIDSQELELVGIFHSHPAGPETVSATDIREAAYDVVHLVCFRVEDGGDWKVRGFWIQEGLAEEVDLLVGMR